MLYMEVIYWNILLESDFLINEGIAKYYTVKHC